MTIRDDILEDLRQGTHFREIKRKYRGVAATYSALRQFLEESKKSVEERRDKLQQLERELHRVKSELKSGSQHKKVLQGELDSLKMRKEKLAAEVERRSQKLNALSDQAGKLEAEGFTPEILKRLSLVERRPGCKLLEDVKTVEKCRQREKRCLELEEKHAKLESSLKVLEAKQRRIKEDITSGTNKLDELRLRTRSFRQAMAVVGFLFKKGFKTEDIRSLQSGLEAVGVVDDVVLSVTRLVDGLRKVKSLYALEERLTLRRKELAETTRELSEAKSVLKGLKTTTLKSIEKAEACARKSIANVLTEARGSMKKTVLKFDRQTDRTLGRIEDHIQNSMGSVVGKLDRWGQLQKQTAILEKNIKYGTVFLGIHASDEYLKKIPLSMVSRVMDRVELWFEFQLPDYSANPSEDVHQRDMNLYTWHQYRLSALVAFVAEGLHSRLLEEMKRETNQA